MDREINVEIPIEQRTAEISKALVEKRVAQAAVKKEANSISVASESLSKAVKAEMEATVPEGMKVVPFEIAYMGNDRYETGFVCVPKEYTQELVWGYKAGQDVAGRFGTIIPATMLVWDGGEDSSTWLQWRPWEEVFADFLRGYKN